MPAWRGALLLSDNDAPRAEEAMRKAGGKWASSRGTRHQVDTRVEWGGTGGVDYDLRAKSQVRKRIKGRAIAYGRELARTGKELHGARRAAVTGSITPTYATGGVAFRLWDIRDIVKLVEASEPEPSKRGPYKGVLSRLPSAGSLESSL